MSTQLKGGYESGLVTPLNPDFKCVIVRATWNSHITTPLTEGASQYLLDAGVKEENITILEVPGAVELVYGAKRAIRSLKPDAVIVVGCVIRGDTPHFEYVCDNVTSGTSRMNAEGDTPVIFCLLTFNSEQQALDRAGGILGNKGTEAAEAAVIMANLARNLPVD